MWSAVINDQCNLSIFFSKLIFKLPYPFFQVLLIHFNFSSELDNDKAIF